MELSYWLSYAAVAAAVALSPGPSVMLVANNAGRYGRRAALLTIVGDLSANLMQMLVALFFVRSLTMASSFWLTLVQGCGAAYLAYLGLAAFYRAMAPQVPDKASQIKHGGMQARAMMQGFLVAATNPKSIGFFIALLPQFVDPAGSFPLQAAILISTYLSFDASSLLLYSSFGPLLLGRLSERSQKLFSACLYLTIAGLFLTKLM